VCESGFDVASCGGCGYYSITPVPVMSIEVLFADGGEEAPPLLIIQQKAMKPVARVCLSACSLPFFCGDEEPLGGYIL
jgi:hypothetical protein